MGIIKNKIHFIWGGEDPAKQFFTVNEDLRFLYNIRWYNILDNVKKFAELNGDYAIDFWLDVNDVVYKKILFETNKLTNIFLYKLRAQKFYTSKHKYMIAGIRPNFGEWSDMLRLKILSIYEGIYIDTDNLPIKSLGLNIKAPKDFLIYDGSKKNMPHLDLMGGNSLIAVSKKGLIEKYFNSDKLPLWQWKNADELFSKKKSSNKPKLMQSISDNGRLVYILADSAPCLDYLAINNNVYGNYQKFIIDPKFYTIDYGGAGWFRKKVFNFIKANEVNNQHIQLTKKTAWDYPHDVYKKKYAFSRIETKYSAINLKAYTSSALNDGVHIVCSNNWLDSEFARCKSVNQLKESVPKDINSLIERIKDLIFYEIETYSESNLYYHILCFRKFFLKLEQPDLQKKYLKQVAYSINNNYHNYCSRKLNKPFTIKSFNWLVEFYKKHKKLLSQDKTILEMLKQIDTALYHTTYFGKRCSVM